MVGTASDSAHVCMDSENIVKENDMWIVKGIFCGCNAIWGAYTDRKTAEEVARRVEGTVEPWENKQK